MRTNTEKLLKEISGKEGFQILTSTYLDRLQGKEPAFSDTDLDQMIAGFTKRPLEEKAYYEWCEAYPVISFFAAETRVQAMTAVWRLCVLAAVLTQQLKPAVGLVEKKDRLPDALSLAAKVNETIGDYARLHLILEAFGEVLKCDVPLKARYERGILQTHIELYNRIAECIEDQLEEEAFEDGQEIDKRGRVLPILSITPSDVPGDLKCRLVAAIEDRPKKSFWDLLAHLDRPLERQAKNSNNQENTL